MSLILSGTDGLSDVDGSASTPAIRGTDANTGIFFPAADTIGFSEGGVQVGEFDSSANFKFNSGYGSVATAYGCRAWVNFNGTGTVAIRGSANVSSISDDGTGRYTVNLTTAMPDANYSPVGFLNGDSGTGAGAFAAAGGFGINALTTTSIKMEYYNGGFIDSALVFLAVFR